VVNGIPEIDEGINQDTVFREKKEKLYESNAMDS
jgi:hypothetical protein